MPDLPDIDDLDRRILAELQDDARQTNRELAAAVHVSTSTSSERVRALRAEGVIRGYHADVALEALGRHVQALIAVRIRPPSRENIEASETGPPACPS
jgi:DNA-binding Lrp family transcriptional regulator